MSAAEPSPNCGRSRKMRRRPAHRVRSRVPDRGGSRRRPATRVLHADGSAPQRPGTRPHRGWARPGGPALRPACPDRSRRPASCPGSAPAAGRPRCPAPRAASSAPHRPVPGHTSCHAAPPTTMSAAPERTRCPNDVRTAPQSDLDRAVRGPVVDDHGAVTRWKGSQYTWQRSRFVQARQHNVHNGLFEFHRRDTTALTGQRHLPRSRTCRRSSRCSRRSGTRTR
jgi:hypothetical protein